MKPKDPSMLEDAMPQMTLIKTVKHDPLYSILAESSNQFDPQSAQRIDMILKLRENFLKKKITSNITDSIMRSPEHINKHTDNSNHHVPDYSEPTKLNAAPQENEKENYLEDDQASDEEVDDVDEANSPLQHFSDMESESPASTLREEEMIQYIPQPLKVLTQPFNMCKYAILSRPYAKRVLLIESIFKGRPPTIFIQYPPFCRIARKLDGIIKVTPEEKDQPTFGIADSTYVYKCVVYPLKYSGFAYTRDSNWNVYWNSTNKQEILKEMSETQKINHFPGTAQIGRKDNLWRNINRFRQIFKKDYEICPQTYVFPEDYKKWSIEKVYSLSVKHA